MVNNNKISNYYRKKNSLQRNKSSDKEATESAIAAINHQAHASNKNQANTEKTIISDIPKQSSLATAATSQVVGPTTGRGVVRKILGSVVIGEGTTTMVYSLRRGSVLCMSISGQLVRLLIDGLSNNF
jgi:preprotein translocase subunit SecF